MIYTVRLVEPVQSPLVATLESGLTVVKFVACVVQSDTGTDDVMPDDVMLTTGVSWCTVWCICPECTMFNVNTQMYAHGKRIITK